MKHKKMIRAFEDEVFKINFTGCMGLVLMAYVTVVGCASSASPPPMSTVNTGGTSSCVHACDLGMTRCTPTGDVIVCAWSGDCRAWSAATPCAIGQQCKGGTCVSECTPVCNGKICGDDGCGGDCGSCSGGQSLCHAGQCLAPCTDADEYCDGDTLHMCDSVSELLTTGTCSKAHCVESGYVDYSNCGGNAGVPGKFCLCKSCSASDNSCDAGAAHTCNEFSGKMTVHTCDAGKICFNGACAKPCQNECSAASCQGGKQVGCQQGADGCMKKLGPVFCKPGEVCLASMKGCGFCELHSDCSAMEVCAKDGLCRSPFGLNLKVTVKSAIFPENKPTGGAWDGFGGLPDPKICVDSEDGSVCTSVVKNSTTAAFNEDLTITLASGSKFCVVAWDADFASDDKADGACWNNLAGLIKEGGIFDYLYDKVVWVSFAIDTAN